MVELSLMAPHLLFLGKFYAVYGYDYSNYIYCINVLYFCHL